jgi:hypothetical protein
MKKFEFPETRLREVYDNCDPGAGNDWQQLCGPAHPASLALCHPVRLQWEEVTCTSTLQTSVTTTVWEVNPLKSGVHFWWDPVSDAFICYTI